jgi:hypothetical protein
VSIGHINRIYVSPEKPIDFSFKLAPYPEVRFTLFDVMGGEVEYALWNSRDPVTGIAGGTFRFGYLDGKQSREYNFQVEHILPAFVGNAYQVTVIGTTLLTPMISNNMVSGTVEEILQELADIHDMDLMINPPLGESYMMDKGYNDQGSTAPREMTHHKWSDETDGAYIETILQWARDQQGKGGYRYYITNNDSGRAVLNISKPENNSAEWTFTVQDKKSTVLAWLPEVDFSSVVANANDVQKNCYQRFTGDDMKFVMNQSATQDLQETFGLNNSAKVKSVPSKGDPDQLVYTNSDQMPDDVTGSCVRSRFGASSSAMGGINPFLNSHLWAWMDSYNATLLVEGDPDLAPSLHDGRLGLCDVNCYWPTNYDNENVFSSEDLHYTSGRYLVEEVEHIIRAGSYTSRLKLTRACSEIPESTE